MRYALNRFETIPKSAQQQLAAFKIHTTDDLLNQAATPCLRDRLAKETGIPLDDLNCWAGISDLVRIKGIGPAHAELLVKSGLIRNVQQFVNVLGVEKENVGAKRIADRESIGTAASDLVKKLSEFIKQHPIAKRIPSTHELAEAVEEASELRPRLVLSVPDDDRSFRQHVFTRFRENRRHSRKMTLMFVGVLGVFSVLAFTVLLVWERGEFNQLAANRTVLGYLGVQFLGVATYYSNLSLAILLLMTLAMILVIYAIYDLLKYVLDTWVVLWFFNNAAYRGVYRKVTALHLEGMKRATWWGIAVLVIIAIGLLVHYISALEQDITIVEMARGFTLPVAIGGVLIVIVACVPVGHFYLKVLKVDPAIDELGAQRYLIYSLGQISLLPIMILLLTQVAFPGLFWAHTYVYRTLILPSFRADIMEWRLLIETVKLDDEASQLRRETMLDFYDEMIIGNLTNYGLVVTQDDREVFDVYIPLALNIIVWMALTGVALLFVLPYLVLGGWRRGVFYIIVLYASFYGEDLLQEYAPSWFSLKRGSISSWLVILFVVFVNALFFEWVFTSLTERKKVCPDCNIHLDENAVYCSVCGLMQP